MYWDVDGVVCSYRETDVHEVNIIFCCTAKVLRVSIGRCGVIVIFWREWDFHNQVAVFSQIGGWLWSRSSSDDLKSLCLRHVICQSQRSVCLLFLCSGSVSVVNWIRLAEKLPWYSVYYYRKLYKCVESASEICWLSRNAIGNRM